MSTKNTDSLIHEAIERFIKNANVEVSPSAIEDYGKETLGITGSTATARSRELAQAGRVDRKRVGGRVYYARPGFFA